MPDLRALAPVEEGSFQLDNLPACTLRVRIDAGDRTARLLATVHAGRTSHVGDVTLIPRAHAGPRRPAPHVAR